MKIDTSLYDSDLRDPSPHENTTSPSVLNLGVKLIRVLNESSLTAVEMAEAMGVAMAYILHERRAREGGT
jgi:hypothetical protein